MTTPFGFVPIGTTDGSDYHGKLRDVILDNGANLFIGDMLINSTSVAGDKVQRVETALAATLGALLVGALVEIYPDFTDEGTLVRNYHAAGADGDGRIAYGSQVIYAAREDADTSVIDGTEIGGSVSLIQTTTGDLITGISGQALDSSTAIAGITLPLRILQLDQQQGNDYQVAAGGDGSIFQVVINEGDIA